jgi:hypothetical protein
MAKPPLNVDQRLWALGEIERLEKENAALKEQLGNRPGGGDPGATPPGWTPPPAVPQTSQAPYKPGEGDV